MSDKIVNLYKHPEMPVYCNCKEIFTKDCNQCTKDEIEKRKANEDKG